MRMKMVNPDILGDECKHLNGEYNELFKIAGHFKKGWKITKYISSNCIEAHSLIDRYNELRQECLSRNWKLKSTFPVKTEEQLEELISYLPPEHRNYKIDRDRALQKVLECPTCYQKFMEFMGPNRMVG